MVREGEVAYGSEREAICAVADMLGPTAETVRKWVRRAEIDEGVRTGVTTDERAWLPKAPAHSVGSSACRSPPMCQRLVLFGRLREA